MATHQMVALTPLRYGGKQLKPGDAFEAQGSDARVLVAIKKAKFSEAAAKPKPAAKTIAETVAKPVAKTAEPTTEPAPASTAVPGMTTKSTYKTRDLKPE